VTDFDAVVVGDELPERSWGPLTEMHLMRWSAAMENWHRIHYDAPFAVEHDGLPAPLVNGSLKQHLIVSALRDWAGETGWLWKLSFRFHGMDVVRDRLTFGATVTSVTSLEAYGLCELDVRLRNQREEVNTTGHATVVLPHRDGPRVPYPFPGVVGA
jgi:acyl dehydratase